MTLLLGKASCSPSAMNLRILPSTKMVPDLFERAATACSYGLSCSGQAKNFTSEGIGSIPALVASNCMRIQIWIVCEQRITFGVKTEILGSILSPECEEVIIKRRGRSERDQLDVETLKKNNPFAPGSAMYAEALSFARVSTSLLCRSRNSELPIEDVFAQWVTTLAWVEGKSG